MAQEYEEWMKDKSPRKTSDDTHTPVDVYEVVASWVSDEYHIPRELMCRPFYPGGDFKNFDYNNKIVVDNPPFSILSKISRFYQQNDVKFFLFAPALTCFSSTIYYELTHIFIGNPIIYDNGVRVSTHFLTNLEPNTLARSALDLSFEIRNCESQSPRKRNKVDWGDDEFNGARLNTLTVKGKNFRFTRDECEHIKETRSGHHIYGGGILVKGWV